MPARGIRNHNPGNIRKSADPWQGLAPEQPDPEFFTFISAEWGIRALARLLITYYDRHGLRTIHEIIHRWAPAVGERPDGSGYTQNTAAYVDHVSRLTGFGRLQPLALHDYAHLRPLVEAIIRHENGVQPYSRDEIDRGLELAGIVPPSPARLATPEAKGAAAAAGGAAAASAATLLSDVAPAMPLLNTLAQHLPGVVLTLVVIGGAWVAWTHWRRSRRGK